MSAAANTPMPQYGIDRDYPLLCENAIRGGAVSGQPNPPVRGKPSPLDVLRSYVAELDEYYGQEAHGREALAQVETLVEAAKALLAWAEKDRGGGYPEADRSEEWYTHRDFARAALAPFVSPDMHDDFALLETY